jgi:hypothetical protein
MRRGFDRPLLIPFFYQHPHPHLYADSHLAISDTFI